MNDTGAVLLTWRQLARMLGERMRYHAFCNDHLRAEHNPTCPFCADREAFKQYQRKIGESP